MSDKVIEIRDSLLEAEKSELPIKITLKGKIIDMEHSGVIESIRTATTNKSEKSFFSLDNGNIRLNLENQKRLRISL